MATPPFIQPPFIEQSFIQLRPRSAAVSEAP
jgi:hypothetical protein